MDFLIEILKEEPLLGVIPDQMIAGKYGVTYEFTGWRLFASPRGTMG